MSILQAVTEFLQGCPHLSKLAGGEMHIDLLNPEVGNYGVALNSDSKLECYIDGSQLRCASFALYAREVTIDDMARLEGSDFCEDFSAWVEEQNLNLALPCLGAGMSAESVSAEGGYLYDLAENALTGVYQIQFKLIYRRDYSGK